MSSGRGTEVSCLGALRQTDGGAPKVSKRYAWKKSRFFFDHLKLRRYDGLKIYGLLYRGELLKSILLQTALVTKGAREAV